MLIEYTITFENGALKITQRVEPGGSGVQTKVPQVPGQIEVLPATHAEAKAAGAGAVDITPAGEGGGNGDLPGKGGGNGDLPGKGGGNGDLPGKGGGDGGAQVVVFGPIVIDASGLIPKKSSSTESDSSLE